MSKSLFVILFTFLIYKISVNAHEDINKDVVLSLKENELCHELPRSDIEKYLSTKTPYRVVANLDDKPKNYEGKIKENIENLFSNT